ncbi:hypothetical protein RH858_13885 [Halalkaliarchaeum sp. AArc-GB]|uniref:surface carbohydrate biosynthesis protein n=1 Tax=Halalkaliarchaeum sp. AArc-GB TaxID=3074078 RepID=UPI0028560AF7|nr:surface carbohydrate biosynthesis protein [Halalkaliarchaeum sp. AArc-GB]MDR5674220.1 hypothetical protein [Halalkaliarchaeum sp. AArc-GB]
MKVSIPIETRVRELDSKLYLAIRLASDGHEVYLGRSSSVNRGFDIIDPDIYISNCNSVDRNKADKIRAKVLLLDSEGGIFADEATYSKRISAERLENIDWYLAWGDRSKRIVEGNSTNTNISVTGNPRFDLLQPPLRSIYERRSKKLVEKFGDYILINTNFSIANHSSCNNPPKNVLKGTSDVYNFGERYEYVKNMYLSFIDMIHTLGESVENNIIVRPHPSENFLTYEKEFKDYGNIKVIHRGDVRDWIAGSQVVIHNSCTTGIEAALMERNVYAYDPIKKEKDQVRSDVPNLVSKRIKSVDKLVKRVQSDLYYQNSTYMMSEEKKDQLKIHIGNIDFNSADRIANIINNIELPVDEVSSDINPPGIKERLKRIIVYSLGHKSLYFIRSSGLKESWKTSNQKFPHITDNEIKQKIDDISDLIDVNKVSIRRHNKLEDTFCVTAKC